MARWMEWGAVSMFDTEGTHFPEQSNVPITTSKDGRTWWLHARPGAQIALNLLCNHTLETESAARRRRMLVIQHPG